MDETCCCCEICCTMFSAEASPRVMPCGHSCCTSCLKKLFDSTKRCHLCRKTLTNDDVQRYPVNYFLLGLCEKLFSNEDNIKHAKSLLQTKLKKYEEIANLAHINLVERRSTLDSMMKSKAKLKEVSKIDDASLNVSEINVFLEQIQLQMNDVIETFHLDVKTESNYKIDLHSSHFNDPTDFLAKIRREIVCGRSIAAVSRINSEDKFANIKLADERLYIHAFDKLEREDGKVTLVDFQDLQENLFSLKTELHGFLLLDYNPEIAPHLALIEIFNIATISYGIQFLKLCTGELGVSYKGCTCDQELKEKVLSFHYDTKVKTAALKILNFEFQTKKQNSYYLLFCDKNSNRKKVDSCDDHRYLFLQNDGSFELNTITNSYVGPISELGTGISIGKIRDCKFHKELAENITILDCGIAVQWP